MMTTAVRESAVETCDDPLVRLLTAEPMFEAGGVISADDSLRHDLQLAADSDVPVLLSGGRAGQAERVATWIHRRSARRTAPFLVMDARAGGVPGAVLESLRRVQVGTLFIAHLDKLSQAMQTVVMQFLEQPERHGRAGLRVIAASDESTLQCVRRGQFRADLYYRLNLIHISMR